MYPRTVRVVLTAVVLTAVPRVSCRLPDATEPVSYALRVTPLADGGRAFRGLVDVVIRARRYATEVVLNASDLNVTAVTAFEDVRTGRRVPVSGHALDRDAERLTIAVAKPLVPRRLYRFAVGFEGELRDDYTGLHGHAYDDDDSTGGRLAVTRFEPTYARRAFPCYDEPRFKTPYDISVARSDRHLALSNMPLRRSEVDPETGWTWDHFETTKPIPTYLVAFAVTDFGENPTDGRGNVTVYARERCAGRTAYMTRRASGLLDSAERFTGIPGVLPKLDIVAVPSPDDYSAGGCGLNAHNERRLTLSDRSTADDKMAGTVTVLREILHQWFGNMVTAPRWEYAWLNEGLRNYLSYYVPGTTEPDWDVDGTFVVNVHQRALAWDEAADAHPLTYAAPTADDPFDPIASDKSAAVFRMLRHAVGEANFGTALNKFLNDFAYAGAGPKELWETFDGVLYDAEYDGADDDVTVDDTMRLWTEQAGYPLVTVGRSNGTVVLTQERFSVSGPRDTAKWFVRLTYTTELNADFDDFTSAVWLRPTDEQKAIPVPADAGWMVFNLQSTGFYRVNYDENNWKLLLIQLVTRPDRIHVLNRAQIVDDACHLSRAGLVPYDYYISLLEYLLMEDHVTPWNSAIDGLSTIMAAIRRYPADHAAFEKYVKNLAEVLYGKLSQNRMSNGSTKIGWSKLFTWSCRSGSSGCEKSALSHFDAWMNGQSVPPEMEEASLCAGAKRGNRTAWTKVYEYHRTAESSSSRRAALRALACVEDVRALSSYLRLAARSGRGDHVKTVFDSFATTTPGVGALADYLSRGPLTDAHAVHAYTALASAVATDDEIGTLDEIRRSVGPSRLRAKLDEKRRTALSNMEWMERDHERIVRAIGIVV